jgi:succinate dehydrogenase / fumarate reductase, iron-sulfur subunit
MPEYTLNLRRYLPDSGRDPFWQQFTVKLPAHHSVLEGILQARNLQDGTIGIRCSCRSAICGSCAVCINGTPMLACRTHVGKALEDARDGAITVEPMGNMPVLKDLIVDMDAVHWKKIHRVTPWLINQQPIPEREYIVSHDAMVDVTQTMACIQCGACVAACLSMEVDPEFIGPAALAKAYRFVGDPRDAQQRERLDDLAEDPHGLYDCTHCFMCVQVCPKDVAPMDQIMRLRRIASSDHEIVDANNGYRHEHAFAQNIRHNVLLNEADLLPDSYGGKFHPRAIRELLSDLPVILRALLRCKVTLAKALLHRRHPAREEIERVYGHVESERPRRELNLYVTGYEEGPGTSPSIVQTAGAGAEPWHSDAIAGPPSSGGEGR